MTLNPSWDNTSFLFTVQDYSANLSFDAFRNSSIEGVPSQHDFPAAKMPQRFPFDQSGPIQSTKLTMTIRTPEYKSETVHLRGNPVEERVLVIPGIDEPWPDDLAQATAFASEDILSEVWNTPEEDEAWRDM